MLHTLLGTVGLHSIWTCLPILFAFEKVQQGSLFFIYIYLGWQPSCTFHPKLNLTQACIKCHTVHLFIMWGCFTVSCHDMTFFILYPILQDHKRTRCRLGREMSEMWRFKTSLRCGHRILSFPDNNPIHSVATQYGNYSRFIISEYLVFNLLLLSSNLLKGLFY